MLMQYVVADANVDRDRDTEAYSRGQHADVFMGTRSVEDGPAERFAQADLGRSGRDHIVHAAGFLPEAELSRLDIPGHAFRGCPDEGELPIVNGSRAVHGDMIDPAALHHLNQETSDSRPEN